MAKHNNHTVLWVLGLGGAAYFAYQWYVKGKAPAPGAAAAAGPSDILPTTANSPYTLTTSANSSHVINPTNIVVTGASSDIQGNNLPPGITQDMYNQVMTWAHGVGSAPVVAFAAAMVPSEYQGMYDLITNAWPKLPAIKPTAAQTAFWNNLRTKYDPTHKSW